MYEKISNPTPSFMCPLGRNFWKTEGKGNEKNKEERRMFVLEKVRSQKDLLILGIEWPVEKKQSSSRKTSFQ